METIINIFSFSFLCAIDVRDYQQYLEFTERERPPNVTTEPEMTFVSSPGEPGPRGPPGVLEKINFLFLIKIQIQCCS